MLGRTLWITDDVVDIASSRPPARRQVPHHTGRRPAVPFLATLLASVVRPRPVTGAGSGPAGRAAASHRTRRAVW